MAQETLGTDFFGDWNVEQYIYGPTVATPELHNISYNDKVKCPNPVPLGGNKWCTMNTILTVATENDKWVFIGQPEIDVVEDNQGSASWNVLGAPDRFFVELQNPHNIRVRIITGSRSIKVRLRCLARHYP